MKKILLVLFTIVALLGSFWFMGIIGLGAGLEHNAVAGWIGIAVVLIFDIFLIWAVAQELKAKNQTVSSLLPTKDWSWIIMKSALIFLAVFLVLYFIIGLLAKK